MNAFMSSAMLVSASYDMVWQKTLSLKALEGSFRASSHTVHNPVSAADFFNTWSVDTAAHSSGGDSQVKPREWMCRAVKSPLTEGSDLFFSLRPINHVLLPGSLALWSSGVLIQRSMQQRYSVPRWIQHLWVSQMDAMGASVGPGLKGV